MNKTSPTAWYKHTTINYTIIFIIANLGGSALKNYSDKLELIKNTLEPLAPWISIPLVMDSLAFGLALIFVVTLSIWVWPTIRKCGYLWLRRVRLLLLKVQG